MFGVKVLVVVALIPPAEIPPPPDWPIVVLPVGFDWMTITRPGPTPDARMPNPTRFESELTAWASPPIAPGICRFAKVV